MSEQDWIDMIHRGLAPQTKGDLVKCETCGRWFNVPCQCNQPSN